MRRRTPSPRTFHANSVRRRFPLPVGLRAEIPWWVGLLFPLVAVFPAYAGFGGFLLRDIPFWVRVLHGVNTRSPGRSMCAAAARNIVRSTHHRGPAPVNAALRRGRDPMSPGMTMGTAAIVLLAIAGPGICQDNQQHRIIPIRAMTQDVEILHGDPDVAGRTFVMRIRELPGGIIPPHRHPVDEHITVVQGTVYFGIGDKFDRAATTEMKAGSYAFIPKGTTMFGYTPEAAIVQVHGIGPFHIHWRDGTSWRDRLRTLDDSDAGTVFKFKRGEEVVAERGVGRIRQGYDSGDYIGYEIEGANGTLFMAEESELQVHEARQPGD